jgi:predicted DCC family thiol-disulfide oxidoreductase YuxK
MGAKVYYDADCRLCSGGVSLVSRAGVLGKVAWTPVQSGCLPEGVSRDDLDRAMHLETPSGLYSGFDAVRRIALRTPVLWALALVFWLPGMGALGSRAYAIVARNRRRLA